MSFNITRRTLLKASAVVAAAAPAVAGVAQPAVATGGSNRIAIIGSGYGGAVAARKLALAGKQVDLIEMGTDWDKMRPINGRIFTTMTAPSSRSMWFKARTDMPFSYLGGLDLVNRRIDPGAGALDIEYFANMKVYVGRGVGGGSLVNGGMAVTPRRSFFEMVLPQVDAEEMYNVYFPRANSSLRVNDPAMDLVMNTPWYQFARVSAAQAKKAGIDHVMVPNVYDFDYMRKEAYGQVPRSALDKQVIFGNDHGKNSLPKTLLKEAFSTGRVNLIPMTEVQSLERKPDGTFQLRTKTIDFNGNLVERRTREYDRVVLAAGSVGTTRLLLSAQAEGAITGMSESLGRGWGPNGNTMHARRLRTWSGARQSTIPVMGLSNWDDSVDSVFAEIAPFPAGIDLRTGVYLAITNNPNTGTFTWNRGSRKMELDWGQEHSEPSVRAARKLFNRINNANPGTGPRGDLFEQNKTYSDYFTYHPLGGAVLGEVTDLQGEVKGVPGLFVMDSSLIPAKIGVNPFVTITALAERNMDRLLAAQRF
ncbi:GMC oxidoreductase [Rothia uropygialis]|uniref:GMC oxidoreductase n=1 Tax=Kocuria sp. 36 TaxID=1415402 RepID=UPI00101D451C|nr:GMC oxidoreductase [Kocuria sp. 36]